VFCKSFFFFFSIKRKNFFLKKNLFEKKIIDRKEILMGLLGANIAGFQVDFFLPFFFFLFFQKYKK